MRSYLNWQKRIDRTYKLKTKAHTNMKQCIASVILQGGKVGETIFISLNALRELVLKHICTDLHNTQILIYKRNATQVGARQLTYTSNEQTVRVFEYFTSLYESSSELRVLCKTINSNPYATFVY